VQKIQTKAGKGGRGVIGHKSLKEKLKPNKINLVNRGKARLIGQKKKRGEVDLLGERQGEYKRKLKRGPRKKSDWNA